MATLNGKTVTKKLPIRKLNTKPNTQGKVAIICDPCDENKTGVFQLSTKHLDNIADGVNATNGDVLKGALAASLDDNHLEVEFQWNKKGAKVLDNKGKEVLDVDGNTRKFDKDHWGTNNMDVVLSEDSVDHLAELNRDIDKEDIRAARRAKRKNSRKSTPKVEETTEENL